jgi:hypothetical protein
MTTLLVILIRAMMTFSSDESVGQLVGWLQRLDGNGVRKGKGIPPFPPAMPSSFQSASLRVPPEALVEQCNNCEQRSGSRLRQDWGCLFEMSRRSQYLFLPFRIRLNRCQAFFSRKIRRVFPTPIVLPQSPSHPPELLAAKTDDVLQSDVAVLLPKGAAG